MGIKELDKFSDEKLFDLYKRTGKDKFFGVLYERYARKVYAYCIRAVPDKETARDIFQKSWAAVIEKKDAFTGGNFIAWLMVITRNFCLMEKRIRKYTDEINENTLITDADANSDFKLRELLMNQINKLPDEMAELIKLKYFDEFSYKEIVDILGINMSLVKVRLFRAKKILAESLAFLKEDE